MTMYIASAQTDSLVEFESLLTAAADSDAVQSILILACDQNNIAPDAVDGLLKRMQKPVFGGIFPEILVGREKWTQGFVIVGLPCAADVRIVHRLSDMSQDYETMIETAAPAGTQTMLVLVDGLAARITALIDSLFASSALR